MGEVIALIRIMPADIDSFETLKQKAKAAVPEAKRWEEEPLAFGLKALNIVITAEDKGGGTDALENKIKGIPGVGDVEVVAVTLI